MSEVCTYFDMTPVWVTAVLDWRGPDLFDGVQLKQGKRHLALYVWGGRRIEDRLALAEAPVGLPLTVQLPLRIVQRAGFSFTEVDP